VRPERTVPGLARGQTLCPRLLRIVQRGHLLLRLVNVSPITYLPFKGHWRAVSRPSGLLPDTGAKVYRLMGYENE
jgi:hypothetical protein